MMTQPLGEGAMGQIFLCEDMTLFRKVAVKFLKGVEMDPGLRQRFLTEARVIARLARQWCRMCRRASRRSSIAAFHDLSSA